MGEGGIYFNVCDIGRGVSSDWLVDMFSDPNTWKLGYLISKFGATLDIQIYVADHVRAIFLQMLCRGYITSQRPKRWIS